MFDKVREIVPGMVVLDYEGLAYRVEDVRESTTGDEHSREIGARVVNYVQLEQNNFPPGTPWSEDEKGFRQYFTPLTIV